METLRHVEIEPVAGQKYTLRTWDTGRLHPRGTTMIGYELIAPNGTTLFTGEDFSGSPMDADDSDACLRGLVNFLSLRLGDTDAEYFANYTPEQTAFAESYDCEAMQMWGMDGEEFAAPFAEVDAAVSMEVK